MKLQSRKDDRIEHLRPEGEQTVGIFDLSEGGVGVYLDISYASGTEGSVRLIVGDLTLSVKVVVAHCEIFGKAYRTGFRYLDIGPGNKETIREMVNRYSRGVPVKAQLKIA